MGRIVGYGLEDFKESGGAALGGVGCHADTYDFDLGVVCYSSFCDFASG